MCCIGRKENIGQQNQHCNEEGDLDHEELLIVDGRNRFPFDLNVARRSRRRTERSQTLGHVLNDVLGSRGRRISGVLCLNPSVVGSLCCTLSIQQTHLRPCLYVCGDFCASLGEFLGESSPFLCIDWRFSLSFFKSRQGG